MNKLILGCGYLGRRVAQAWLGDGHEVLALTRSLETAARLRARGIRPIVGDVTGSLDLSDCDEIDTLLFAIGFDRTAGKSIREVYVDGLRRVLDCLPAPPRRFIYISSTGVYAQNDGQWVNEQSLSVPLREGGKACLAAEELLRQCAIGERTMILRLAGIYGADRLPKLQDVIAGRPIDGAADGYLNLIHVDDAVRVVLAAETQLMPPELLLVSDGAPVLRGEFYRELARRSHSPPPQFTAPNAGSPTAARASTDKRIDNSRLRELLQLQFRFPSYVEGLASILATQGD
ncbi:MAG: SDR family oxidoreductase [Planctomycetaceae bacterium]|nr:SDR family oxidoreductase [Planctomycetales bacterium]MCB9921138.1 SDR family oxidoreductase [Planctomycetaceae bacterium]